VIEVHFLPSKYYVNLSCLEIKKHSNYNCIFFSLKKTLTLLCSLLSKVTYMYILNWNLLTAQNYYCFLKFRRISQLEQKLLHGNHFVYMMGTTTMETCPWNNNFAVWLYIFSLFGFFFFLFFLIIHVSAFQSHLHVHFKLKFIDKINNSLHV
jgi:hypothetical protein